MRRTSPASWASTRWRSWPAPRSRTPPTSSSTSRCPGRSRSSSSLPSRPGPPTSRPRCPRSCAGSPASSPHRPNGRSAATSWTTRRARRRSRPGKSGSTPPSSPSDPAAPGDPGDGAAGHRAGGPAAVQRARVHPGLAQDGRLDHAQPRRRAVAAVPPLHLGHRRAQRADHRPDAGGVLSRRLRAGAEPVGHDALAPPGAHAGAVLHRRNRADVRVDARPRQHVHPLAGEAPVRAGRRAHRARALFDADDDPDPGRGHQPHRPDLRARRGQSRRATVAGLLAGDAAAVDARRGVGIARRVRVDVQRAAHAGAARRRPSEDDRQRREGPGPRRLQLAGQRSVRGGRPRHHVPAPGRGHARLHPRGWRRRVIGRVVVGLLVGFMTLPTAVVVVASFNPTAILSFPPEGLSLPIGTAAALALVRRPLRARGFWSAMLLSPLIIPGVAIGLGFLILAARFGLLAHRAVLIAAHTVLVLPFVIRSVAVSVANLDPQLERAAASLGARPRRVFRRVTLPLLRPGLFAALLFAVIVSVNEFVVSLFVSTRVTEILPVAMFTYVVNYTDPTMAALSTLFIGATLIAVLLTDRLLGLSRI